MCLQAPNKNGKLNIVACIIFTPALDNKLFFSSFVWFFSAPYQLHSAVWGKAKGHFLTRAGDLCNRTGGVEMQRD